MKRVSNEMLAGGRTGPVEKKDKICVRALNTHWRQKDVVEQGGD